MVAAPIVKAACAGAPLSCSAHQPSPDSPTAGPLVPPRRSSPTAEEDRDPAGLIVAVLDPPKTAAASPTVRSPMRVRASERRGSGGGFSWRPPPEAPAGGPP